MNLTVFRLYVPLQHLCAGPLSGPACHLSGSRGQCASRTNCCCRPPLVGNSAAGGPGNARVHQIMVSRSLMMAARQIVLHVMSFVDLGLDFDSLKMWIKFYFFTLL